MNVAINGTIYPLGGGSGGSGGPSEEIYSTEERRIGTWIDGKPIYRRVLKNIIMTKSNSYEEFPATFPEIETLTRIRGMLVHTSPGPNPKWRALPDNGCGMGLSINKKLMLNNNASWYVNQPISIIMEYTKTTDTAQEEV